jgi:hypothetical protein
MNLLLLIQVDMVTPMCSQLTYEGLLDEVGHEVLDADIAQKSEVFDILVSLLNLH